MSAAKKGFAYNRTRQTFLATELLVADTHWTRMCGLLATSPQEFSPGRGLWIVPCHGVHTFAMRFIIDAIYLDADHRVTHVEQNLRPWRLAPVRMDSYTVLELPCHTVYTTGTLVGDQLELAFDRKREAVA